MREDKKSAPPSPVIIALKKEGRRSVVPYLENCGPPVAQQAKPWPNKMWQGWIRWTRMSNPDQSELVTVIDWIKDNTIDKLIKVV